MKAERPKSHIRWMIRRDMDRVVDIERSSSPTNPWSEKDFVSHLRRRNTIGLVIESNVTDYAYPLVVGFVIYELQKNRLELLSIAIDPNFRRQGLGRALIAKLYFKLGTMRRNRIVTYVSETNFEAQLFLRATGFLAKRVLPNYAERDTRDAYQFELKTKAPEVAS